MSTPAAVTTLLERSGAPGACVAIVNGERHAAWSWGNASVAPRRPAELDSVFRLFSGTKLYTATALMLLVERGAIALDDPIRRHLPELPLRHAITVRQLACHDSGLPETLRGLLAVHFADDPTPTTAEALSRYRVDRGKTPGRGVAYRNVNYAILGELITRVSGEPYAKFIQREVLEPLGSGASFGTHSHAATGYIGRFDPMRLVLRVLVPEVARRIYDRRVGKRVALTPYRLDTAAIGGLTGSVRDFVPLISEMLDHSDGLLRAASKDTMLQVHGSGAAGIMSRVGVGIGWKHGVVNGVSFWNHEGGGAGFCSETRLYPDAGLGVVVLINFTQSRRLSRTAHEICEALRSAVREGTLEFPSRSD